MFLPCSLFVTGLSMALSKEISRQDTHISVCRNIFSVQRFLSDLYVMLLAFPALTFKMDSAPRLTDCTSSSAVLISCNVVYHPSGSGLPCSSVGIHTPPANSSSYHVRTALILRHIYFQFPIILLLISCFLSVPFPLPVSFLLLLANNFSSLKHQIIADKNDKYNHQT